MSKLEYLKRYGKGKRKTTKTNKRSNLYIIDDDDNWKTVPELIVKQEDPEEAPLVAEVRDESILKWQPVLAVEEKSENTNEMESSTSSKRQYADLSHLSPPRRLDSSSSRGDLSPPRKKKTQGNGLTKKPKHKTSSDLNVNPSSQELKRNIDASRLDSSQRNSAVERNAEEALKKSDEEFMQWGRGYVM